MKAKKLWIAIITFTAPPSCDVQPLFHCASNLLSNSVLSNDMLFHNVPRKRTEKSEANKTKDAGSKRCHHLNAKRFVCLLPLLNFQLGWEKRKLECIIHRGSYRKRFTDENKDIVPWHCSIFLCSHAIEINLSLGTRAKSHSKRFLLVAC